MTIYAIIREKMKLKYFYNTKDVRFNEKLPNIMANKVDQIIIGEKNGYD
ncbi:MAG: hypothetical protein E7D92_01090 [Anaerococcus sp.]|nr:hypothetical protein [Anaerococcus sp.]MDU2353189.1 hypothetical protein [Anaerococcus sp.]